MHLSRTSPNFPLPGALPASGSTPPFDLARDAVELDGREGRELPREIAEGGIHLPIRTTNMNDEFPIEDWYASDSNYSNAHRVRARGFDQALAGAQQLALQEEAVAVVHDASSGERYLVPLAVWNPADESELPFEAAGGTPYWNGVHDHLLIADAGDADVEAVVFDAGAGWVDLTAGRAATHTAS